MKKYGNPRQYRPLSESDMACFGRQILEVLRFLSEKGLPFGKTCFVARNCILVKIEKRVYHLYRNIALIYLMKLIFVLMLLSVFTSNPNTFLSYLLKSLIQTLLFVHRAL
jgi:hypothetical protein